jgi:hypothetical protein
MASHHITILLAFFAASILAAAAEQRARECGHAIGKLASWECVGMVAGHQKRLQLLQQRRQQSALGQAERWVTREHEELGGDRRRGVEMRRMT